MCVGDVNHLDCGGVCAYYATLPQTSSARLQERNSCDVLLTWQANIDISDGEAVTPRDMTSSRPQVPFPRAGTEVLGFPEPLRKPFSDEQGCREAHWVRLSGAAA